MQQETKHVLSISEHVHFWSSLFLLRMNDECPNIIHSFRVGYVNEFNDAHYRGHDAFLRQPDQWSNKGGAAHEL